MECWKSITVLVIYSPTATTSPSSSPAVHKELIAQLSHSLTTPTNDSFIRRTTKEALAFSGYLGLCVFAPK